MRTLSMLTLIGLFVLVIIAAGCGEQSKGANGGLLSSVELSQAEQTSTSTSPATSMKLTQLDPGGGYTGDLFEVSGEGFVEGVKVLLGGKETTAQYISATKLEVTVPNLGRSSRKVTIRVQHPGDGSYVESIEAFHYLWENPRDDDWNRDNCRLCK